MYIAIIISFINLRYIYYFTDSMHSENQLNIDGRRPSDFGTVKCRNIDFRVHKNQFRQRLAFQMICDLFWVSIILVCGMLLIMQVIQTMLLEIPICGFTLANIGIAITAIFKRSFISKVVLLQICLFALFMIEVSFLYGVSIPHLSKLSLVYSGLQIALLLVLNRQISWFILKCLLLGQLILIAFKMDNLLSADWQLILVPLCILFIILIMTATLLLVHTLINQLCGNQANITAKFGLISLSLTLLSFVLQISIPLTWVLLTRNIIVPTVLSIVFHIAIIVYGSIFQTEIALFLCTNYNSVSNNNPQEQRRASTKIYNQDENLRIYRVSENWFVTQIKEIAAANQPVQFQKQECLICMTEESTMVWMPCGHLAVCSTCSSYLIQNCRPICVLCKRKCEFIHKIKIEPPNMETRHKITSAQDYIVEYTQHINKR